MVRSLVDSELKELIKKGVFSSDKDIESYVEPASIDLPVGDVAYLVKQKFLPFSHKVEEVVDKLSLDEIDLRNGGVFFKGQTYLIPILDVDLPKGLSVKISPKSSIGRIDLMVRAVFDNLGLYDTIFEDSKGKLWVEVSPQSFNVKVTSGSALSQLMVFEDNDDDVDFSKDNFVFDQDNKPMEQNFFEKDKLFLSLDVKPNSIIGYQAKSTNEIIDLTKIGEYNWEDFFSRIDLKDEDNFILEKDRFYILPTRENIKVPANYSVEMVPFSHLVGELRAHYAGFFDPGFGGEFGTTGVLEVRPHETLTVYGGQPICLIQIFKNNKCPDVLYGENGNNYQGQKGPKLAKYFKV